MSVRMWSKVLPMTLRARLKGGYVRANVEQGVADGNGKAFDSNANWFFEPVSQLDQGEGVMQCGQKVRIRNALGQLLRVDAQGTEFITDGRGKKAGLETLDEEDEEAEDDANVVSMPATEFLLEHVSGRSEDDEDPMCRLGDQLRIQSCATGQYLRISKDGLCDGLGAKADTETQMVVDRGGRTIAPGSVVALRANATGRHLTGLPDGGLTAQPAEEDAGWNYWLVEKSKKQQSSDEVSDGGVLKQGDVITLRALNQSMLEVDANGRVTCGRSGDGASSSGLGELGCNPQAADDLSGATTGVCHEFVLDRVGAGKLRKNDETIRTGTDITLRLANAPSGESNDDGKPRYLHANADGTLAADARATDRDIGFTLELKSFKKLADPLNAAFIKGDANLLVRHLWDKTNATKLGVLTSHWTNEEELANFKGAVVVSDERGRYNPPKSHGANKGWVAVVDNTTDIQMAARQAKAQGATGLVIRVSNEDALEAALAREKAADWEKPELPAVYVDSNGATELNERGIVLDGGELKGRHLTKAMRACRGIGARGTTNFTPKQSAEVFNTLGNALKEQREQRRIEEAEKAARQAALDAQMAAGGGDDQGDFHWKTSSNTCYLWGKKKMSVNFGKKAPPSAMSTKKYCKTGGHLITDASQHHVHEDKTKQASSKKLDIQHMESRSFTAHRLDAGTATFIQDLDQSTGLEMLSDDSDFKIEYTFEEVEIAVGASTEDMEEDELISDEGHVVARFAVRESQFWLVGSTMTFTTAALFAALFYLLNCNPDNVPQTAHPLDTPVVGQVLKDLSFNAANWVRSGFLKVHS
eukprot:gnl/TRDRNA2_/TRDRNA2_152952_c1_seq1.p1 gnl/TRDRNA2_/TRDRNA2_152952_c1~~gnl/TRDRNA2_/TRDRNA2_152952_c1_seq1.p1  ORF type:complete len:816 (+),score=168.70 gnl/TRDRNA2_/TRDRNA2_152952_c1_seq1:654-3101(+)